ncbi:hypothetical protein TWF730_011261 [Orbilia blumenaviensis]|uniref:Peptidase A1 domain-containing protein n=1 Tax=Orbilia blumenaviensis TaxID=1796055 RepID=A0AAV9UR16_9PEZI
MNKSNNYFSDRYADPSLGLGLTDPTGNSGGQLGYPETLTKQNKIYSSYTSFYNIRNPHGNAGQIVIGGVDRKKIYGNFDVWDDLTLPGEIPTPNVNVITEDNFDEVYNTTFSSPTQKTALISPGTPFIVVPSSLLQRLRLLVPFAYPLGRNDLADYLFALCDRQIDPTYFLQFEFDKVVIRVPLEDLKTTVPERIFATLGNIVAEESNTCRLSLSASQDDAEFSYILGGPFLSRAYVVMKGKSSGSNAITAIAVAKLNQTEEEIIELGAPGGPRLEDIFGDEPAATNRRKKMTIAIASGAAGGALIILLLVLLFFWCRKRRRLAIEPLIPSPAPDFVWQSHPVQPGVLAHHAANPGNSSTG